MRISQFKIENLILDALLEGHKMGEQVIAIDDIMAYCKHLQKYDKIHTDVTVSTTKVRNAMGRTAQYAANKGHLLIPVRQPTIDDKNRLKHQIEGWKICSQKDEQYLVNELNFLAKIRNGHTNSVNDLQVTGMQTKVLKGNTSKQLNI